ncbi:hypothetical protein B9Z55_020996 [Caenorhabditis nigoni]|uniref:Uncharacterized protein n=1 Tax=Caenorhabditis nigoni TaxID=1611254 RepID=A0A2G5TQP9_9PELO|nr:hypothetical protein B9Z55_020996 [Caenorhabditis nigoni]
MDRQATNASFGSNSGGFCENDVVDKKGKIKTDNEELEEENEVSMLYSSTKGGFGCKYYYRVNRGAEDEQ